MVVVVIVVVVVGELLAGLDLSQGNDPNAAAYDLRFAVGLAGMVDIARRVPEHAAIDIDLGIELENVDATIPTPFGALLARQFATPTLGLGNALAGVFDDTRTFGNDFRGEHTPAMDS